jgi:hypothetical protein
MGADTNTHRAGLNRPLGPTVDNLPAPGTTHWVARRKAQVLAAINAGQLSLEQACERYDLSLDELTLWRRAVQRSGVQGLRVTRIQHYKSLYARLDNPQP